MLIWTCRSCGRDFPAPRSGRDRCLACVVLERKRDRPATMASTRPPRRGVERRAGVRRVMIDRRTGKDRRIVDIEVARDRRRDDDRRAYDRRMANERRRFAAAF